MSIHWGMSTILAIHWMVCFLSSQSGIATNVDRLLAPNTTWLLPSEPFLSTWCEPRLKIPGTTAHTPRARPLCKSCRWVWPSLEAAPPPMRLKPTAPAALVASANWGGHRGAARIEGEIWVPTAAGAGTELTSAAGGQESAGLAERAELSANRLFWETHGSHTPRLH